jgi:hypothetical protein
MIDTLHVPLSAATRLCAELDAGENADTPESNAAERMAYSGEYMVPTKVARRLERERDEAREENKKLREVLEWISKRYDDSKPTHAVAMDCYEMSCTARAVLQKEETK